MPMQIQTKQLVCAAGTNLLTHTITASPQYPSRLRQVCLSVLDSSDRAIRCNPAAISLLLSTSNTALNFGWIDRGVMIWEGNLALYDVFSAQGAYYRATLNDKMTLAVTTE